MRPSGWHRIFISKLFTSVFLLIIALYIVFFGLSRLLSWSETVKPKSVHQFVHKPRFRLQQNGEYWIYNEFIVPLRKPADGNETITLATHASYMDFRKLEWLLIRWSAPVSMAVYVTDDNFEATLNSFYHIKYCTVYRFVFDQWVSVQLVFKDKHVPINLRALRLNRDHEFRCHAPYEVEPSNDTFLPNRQHHADYPLNLLKNVARLNAKTYFVLATELDILPTRRLATSFIQFAELYQPEQPLRTVYCIPIVPQICEDRNVPKQKSELVTLVEPYMSQSHLSFSLKPEDWVQLQGLSDWLNSSVLDGEIGVHRVSKSPENCAAYISINSHEPLYDQRLAESPYVANGIRQQVLVGLDFDFVTLDGTFLIRRRAAWWERESGVPSHFEKPSVDQSSKRAHILELIKFNSLTLWPRFR